MANLEIFQLAADVLLVLALFYLCARTAKISPVIQSSVLEGSLRRMVQEADLATRTLQEKLVQRQTRLEELLLDIESAENRLNRSKQSVEEARADLEGRFIKVQRVLQSLQNQAENVSQPTAQNNAVKVESNVAPIEAQETVQPEVVKEDITPDVSEVISVKDEVISKPAAKRNPYAARYAKQSAQPVSTNSSTKQAVNIYGEPINTPAPKTLAQQVEKEVYQADQAPTYKRSSYAPQKVNQKPDIENVYDEAEELLAKGKSPDYVAKLTDLPIEEVNMLAQMIERIPQNQEKVNLSENRLGALDPIRRTLQTL